MKLTGLLIVSLFFVIGLPIAGTAGDVNISIGIAPPPLEFAGPPDVVVVPSGTTNVYLVPDTVGVYFYGGFWYRFYEDHWFRATIYNGPWRAIGVALVPSVVVVIPPDYIVGLPSGYHRIHYGDFHSHWREWGRNHYWNGHAWYRDHSQHHWGGRAFVRPGAGHHGDIHRGGDVHHGNRGPGVKSAGRVPGGSAGPREGIKPGGEGHTAKTQ